MRACLILAHQAAETDYIRMQNAASFRFRELGSRISAIGLQQ